MMISKNELVVPQDGHQRLDLLGVRVSEVTVPSAVGIIDGWIRSRRKTYICVAPASTLVDCQKNDDYRNIVNRADMVTPDGMPVVWLGKARGSRVIERTYGPDLMLALVQAGQAKNYRHFFYGGHPQTLDLLEKELKKKFPEVNIVGKYSPAFTSYAQQESREVVDQINNAKADILWIGLGSPKQDFWTGLHRPLLEVPVMIAVGAAFDFISGEKPQAPLWMQKSGLEWVFRLLSEPRRLWRRYLIGNAEFLYYAGRDGIKRLLKFSK
jgi:N-acetylglucosaminyldiphosphoundecaprenol N-acetyl-beta-D-mannosaminyltransferase